MFLARFSIKLESQMGTVLLSEARVLLSGRVLGALPAPNWRPRAVWPQLGIILGLIWDLSGVVLTRFKLIFT